MATAVPLAYAAYDTPIAGGRQSRKPAPNIAATNMHAYNRRTRRTYYEKGSQSGESRPASLTKMATILVLLDHKPTPEALAQQVTIQSSDQVGGSGNNLKNGDVVTLFALMLNALLPSSNSAATAIARTIGTELLLAETGGTPTATAAVSRFVEAMNARATALGATDTTFGTPSGLTGTSGNSSSPRSINLICAALWGYEVFRSIAGYRSWEMPITRGGSQITVAINTTNTMASDAGVQGGKTGTLTSPPATYNLAVYWQAPNGDIVIVTVFRSSSDAQRFADVRAVLAALPVDYVALQE